MNPIRNRGMNLETHGIPEPAASYSWSSLAYQQDGSIAEKATSQYSQCGIQTRGGQPLQNHLQYGSAGNTVETKNHPETGLQYPFDKEHNFLSRFPVDFKGCFN